MRSMPDRGLSAAELEAERRRLFGLAYRMLGRVTEAEDAAQEALARWSAADRAQIDEPGAWLTTVATRICLDVLGSARHQRETYVGPWLPEPLLTDDTDPGAAAARADSVTLAFLTVLESLSPAERAAFLLHDVFGFPHREVAGMLDRSPAAVRKLASRARSHLEERRPRYETDPDRREAVAGAFLAACRSGDLGALMGLLAPEVTFTGDGGGQASAARRPVHGPDRVGRFLLGLFDRVDDTWRIERVEVNGMPGMLVHHHGQLDSVFALHVADGRITAVQAVRNPDKLTHLRS